MKKLIHIKQKLHTENCCIKQIKKNKSLIINYLFFIYLNKNGLPENE